MDIEFHYYMTYLIASRAGYSPEDATIIAHAAQSVDDNHIPVSVYGGDEGPYENKISQTMDITDPHGDSLIYPIFHFIPGDPKAISAKRKDGREDSWVTTPNSALANKMLDTALASNNLYRIGASAHAYVDTWAHQNFLGKRDSFNEMPDTLKPEYLAVGHAHAEHKPDMPALVWQDDRLLVSKIDNRARFLDAAEHLLEKLMKHRIPDIENDKLAQAQSSLREDLDKDIGPRDDTNQYQNDRIKRYIERAAIAPYGGQAMPNYVEGEWFTEAIIESHSEIETTMRNSVDSFLRAIPLISDVTAFAEDKIANAARQRCTWRSPKDYQETHWYKFQEAIKSHLSECETILMQEGLHVR